jgi:hypothetical protein
MSLNKGIAIGFVIGLAVAGAASLLLRDEVPRDRQAERIAELDAQIQRLDQSVSKLSAVVASKAPRDAAALTNQPGDSSAPSGKSREENNRDANQAQEIAAADAMVDRGIASGLWTRAQANELTAALSDLDVKEQGRIQARISAAINEGRLQIELR